MNDPPPEYPAENKIQSPHIGYQPQPMGGYQQPVGQPVMMQPNMQMASSWGGHRAMMAMLPLKLGRDPVQMRCASCNSDITTEVRETTGMCAWIISIILCSFLLFIFAWIPFCMSSLKDTVHTCPHCKCYCGFHRAYAPGY